MHIVDAPEGRMFTLSQACWGVLAGKTPRSALPGGGQLSRSPTIPVPCVARGLADVIVAAMNDTVADIWTCGANRHRST